MVFERLFVVGDDDVVHVHRFAQQRPRLRIANPAFMKIGTHPVPQAFGLADVNHVSLGVLVEVHAGRGGNRADFLLKIHEWQFEYSATLFAELLLLF